MDCSQKEQLSLVLRFIDDENVIHEEFTGFVHLEDGKRMVKDFQNKAA